VHIPEAYYTKVDGTTWSKQVNKQYSKYKDYSIKLMTRFYINDMYDNVDLSSDFDKGKRQFGTSENIIEYPEYLYFLHEDWLTSYELTTSTDLAWNKITANMVNVLELIPYTPAYPFSILDNEFNNFVNPIDHVKYNHNIFLSSNIPLIKRCFENYITFNNKSQVWSVNE
jgi:hypothetical protein